MWKSVFHYLDQTLKYIVPVAVPIFLILGVIRLLLTPVFVEVEYRLPNFPNDEYGFSEQERLKYAQHTRRYLVNDESIDDLGSLTFADESPLFNARELRHLEDVKAVLQLAFRYLWGAVFALVFGAIWSWRRGVLRPFRKALSRGGWMTVICLVAVLFLALVSFQSFFVVFHRIFFEGNTWLFRYSDTLIRLFPLRFWRDAFIILALAAAGGGFLLGLLASPRSNRHS